MNELLDKENMRDCIRIQLYIYSTILYICGLLFNGLYAGLLFNLKIEGDFLILAGMIVLVGHYA